MGLTPEEIRSTRFYRADGGGYEIPEVDDFVDRVERTLIGLQAEIERLRTRPDIPSPTSLARVKDDLVARVMHEQPLSAVLCSWHLNGYAEPGLLYLTDEKVVFLPRAAANASTAFPLPEVDWFDVHRDEVSARLELHFRTLAPVEMAEIVDLELTTWCRTMSRLVAELQEADADVSRPRRAR